MNMDDLLLLNIDGVLGCWTFLVDLFAMKLVDGAC